MPSILSHQVLDGCDVRCRFCNLWAKGLKPREALSVAEIDAMLEDGRALGLRTYVIYGGEPLMRDDIGEILQVSKRRGYQTIMCSSSGRLLERVDEIGPFIDLFLCSIDGSPETHDHMRNAPGLFERVLEGLRALQRYPGEIRFWTHLHKRNAHEVESIAKIAEQLDVSVDFFPTHSAGRGANSLVLPDAERIAAFDAVLTAKGSGLPIRTHEEVLVADRDDTPFKCTWPAEAVYVTPDGEVYPCERVYTDPEHRLGNVRDEGLARIIASEAFQRYAKELERCNACRLPCVMEVSRGSAAQERRRQAEQADVDRHAEARAPR